MPTETVYGLRGRRLQSTRCSADFCRKRPTLGASSHCPFALIGVVRTLVAHQLHGHGVGTTILAGAFNLILPKTSDVPDEVTGGLPTIGLRMPDHPIAQALLEHHGAPIAAPSANRLAESAQQKPSMFAQDGISNRS